MIENKIPGELQKRSRKNIAKQETVRGNGSLSRRGFLKLAVLCGVMAAGGCKIRQEINDHRAEKIEVEDDFWLSIIESVSRQRSEMITPEEVRAEIITKLFDIPQGWTSGISTRRELSSDGNIEYKRRYQKLDKLIAEYFTNKTVRIPVDGSREEFVISTDFRDFVNVDSTLKLFREQLEKLSVDEGRDLGIEIYNILKNEYEYLQGIYEKNRGVENIDPNSRDLPIESGYLPGGVPVFLRGYAHIPEWQLIHGEHLAETYKHIKYIVIEGYQNSDIGSSLLQRIEDNDEGHYGQLMRDLVKKGFAGVFLEIDGRNASRVLFDVYFDEDNKEHQVELPDIFYEHYFAYLQTENPRFANKIKTVQKLKQFMLAQTTLDVTNVEHAGSVITNKGKIYDNTLAISDNLAISNLPTKNDLGQRAFADALSAIRLHILAKNISEGNIPQGSIVDFEGWNHLSMKSFYLKYPQRAVQIVLRVVHEHMAKYMGEGLSRDEYNIGKNRPENLNKTLEMLRNTDWFNVVRDIGNVGAMPVKKYLDKNDDSNLGQRKIRDGVVNFFDNIDPEIIWALFDDEYIQSKIDEVKSKKVDNK